jgi:hypothetical protein
MTVSRGWNAARIADRLGEGFRRLKLGRRCRWTENCNAFAAKVIGESSRQRRFRADRNKADPGRAAKLRDLSVIAGIGQSRLRNREDARIARRAIKRQLSRPSATGAHQAPEEVRVRSKHGVKIAPICVAPRLA